MRRDRLRWLTARPIAHRGLHDMGRGRPENSLAAFDAAAIAGYAIECDLHPSADGVPVVIHDLSLQRLTGDPRCVRDLAATELAKLHLAATPEVIPTLNDLLELVDGRVPIFLELKHVASRDAGLSWAVVERLKAYEGPAAVMSFSPAQLAEVRAANPNLPRGLIAQGGMKRAWRHLKRMRRHRVHFLSYRASDLATATPIITRNLLGLPLICWTVRTPDEARRALKWSDQITFEGFAP